MALLAGRTPADFSRGYGILARFGGFATIAAFIVSLYTVQSPANSILLVLTLVILLAWSIIRLMNTKRKVTVKPFSSGRLPLIPAFLLGLIVLSGIRTLPTPNYTE